MEQVAIAYIGPLGLTVDLLTKDAETGKWKDEEGGVWPRWEDYVEDLREKGARKIKVRRVLK